MEVLCTGLFYLFNQVHLSLETAVLKSASRIRDIRSPRYPSNLKLKSNNEPNFKIIVAVRQQTFRWPIPPCWDILRIWQFTVDAPTGAKIDEFNLLITHHDILRLNITVKYSVFVHMMQSLEKLKHEFLHIRFAKRLFSFFYHLI